MNAGQIAARLTAAQVRFDEAKKRYNADISDVLKLAGSRNGTAAAPPVVHKRKVLHWTKRPENRRKVLKAQRASVRARARNRAISLSAAK